MENGTVLDLWEKNLGAVPSSTWQQISLETLILADNNLTEISEEIGNLRNLRTLDLGHNRLTKSAGKHRKSHGTQRLPLSTQQPAHLVTCIYPKS